MESNYYCTKCGANLLVKKWKMAFRRMTGEKYITEKLLECPNHKWWDFFGRFHDWYWH